MTDFNFTDFSNAPTSQGGVGELIPEGTLAWAVVKLRPHNMDQGMVLVPSKTSEGNKYLDVELTVEGGRYDRRKVWNMIGLEGSEKWVAQGFAAVRHILEVGREIVNYRDGEPKYRLGDITKTNGDMVLMELDGLRCAIKIGVEKGKDGYPDKNIVRAYLSPNPASDTHKTFLKLVAGETEGVVPAAAKPAAPPRPAWSAPAQAAVAPTPAAKPASGRPAWAGAGPVEHPPI